MMPLFNVVFEGTAVVFAPDEKTAVERCYRANTADERIVLCTARIESEADLCERWELECLPYGLPAGDHRTIGDILREEQQE
jgi:hypothetical protein